MARAALFVGLSLSAVWSPGSAADLVCPSPPATIDVTSGAPVSGDTTGGSVAVDTYACAHSAYGGPGARSGYTGPERVYEFTIATASVVGFVFEPSDPRLRLLLLRDCDEGTCLSEGGCGENLPPATYRLVVDGLDGAAGAYTITPVRLEPLPAYNRWFDCPECSGSCGQGPEAAGSPSWHFDSGNYCGTGCNFALWAVAACGTELHMPFWDVETGHQSIKDVLAGSPASLVATNAIPANLGLPPECRLTSAGPTVAWEDGSCTQIPCPSGNCAGGTDCRTNNVVMDVSTLGNPVLCGVFRVDLDDWGGYVWEAYANCTADRTPQFNLYRDFCSALASYRPRPELGISDVTYDEDACGTLVHGTVTVENIGCLAASGAVVAVDQEPPSGSPLSLTFSAAPGEQVTLPWSWPTAQVPAILRFTVDPANAIAECSEDLGQPVACGRSALLERTTTVTACTLLRAGAKAGPLGVVCAGSPYRLDGSASTFRCATDPPSYRWEDALANPVCDWSASPLCDVPAERLPAGKSRFRLRVRCTPSSTESSSTTAVIAGAGSLPVPLGNRLTVSRAGEDVMFAVGAPPGAVLAGLRVYEGPDPAVTDAARRRVGTTGAGIYTLRAAGGVTADPGLAYYQAVGVSCAGGEGSY